VKTTIENQNINNNITRDYIDYLQAQNNSVLESTLNNKLKTNYFEFLKIYSSKSKFDSGFEFFQNIIMNIIYIALILLACYLIVNNKGLNIGQITLLISLSAMLNTSINNICEFIIKRIEYKQMVGIYKDFINFANIENKGSIAIKDINKITYSNKKSTLNIKNGADISTHKNSILNLLTMNDFHNESKLSINDIDLRDFEYEKLSRKILIVNYDTQLSKE
jgi:ABC-type bacteriocin/lantibiotic exporter with double-glycine peptidase domain